MPVSRSTVGFIHQSTANDLSHGYLCTATDSGLPCDGWPYGVSFDTLLKKKWNKRWMYIVGVQFQTMSDYFLQEWLTWTLRHTHPYSHRHAQTYTYIHRHMQMFSYTRTHSNTHMLTHTEIHTINMVRYEHLLFFLSIPHACVVTGLEESNLLNLLLTELFGRSGSLRLSYLK